MQSDALHQARACYDRQAWREAYDLLSEIDRDEPLAADDLDRLAACAHMLGKESECADIRARAHTEHLTRGETDAAAKCAFLIGFALLAKGQMAHGGGWMARARRVLDEAGCDSVVRGYLLLPEGIGAIRSDETSRAYAVFTEALTIGRRFGDRELIAFARQAQGRALIKLGNVNEGTALLDEVMVSVTAGELLPFVVGDIYCSVIDACVEIFDLRRAHEWTSALTQWCERQPDGIPYRGTCLIRRAEILQLHGSWSDAIGEVERACEALLLPPPKPGAGLAYYHRGELHRLRGEYEQAEVAYRQANELGRKPQPGLALLRLAQGDTNAALASIRRFVEETQTRSVRARVLGAYVEILLAANDVSGARTAAGELREIAESMTAPFLRGLSEHAAGAVDLSDGSFEGALSALGRALGIWRELEAPYEEARTRMLIGSASRMLGDDDTASLELGVARTLLERLGALGDVARIDELARPRPIPVGPTRLTGRELEVLALVATGKTNRAIADGLGLSEKTVARHVSNIFTKLGLSSRAAATAYAYQHRLI